jgi:hypothetical protein
MNILKEKKEKEKKENKINFMYEIRRPNYVCFQSMNSRKASLLGHSLPKKLSEHDMLEKIKQLEILHDEDTHKILILEAKNLLSSESDKKKVEKGAAKILESVIVQLNELFKCDITYCYINNPVILKSGKTVDEVTFDHLQRDPFDRTKR